MKIFGDFQIRKKQVFFHKNEKKKLQKDVFWL